MENTWKAQIAERIGNAVAAARAGRVSAQQLAAECTDLGLPIHRSTIAKIESGNRGNIDVSEWLVLAAALGISPIELLYPDLPDGAVEVLPGVSVDSFDAAQWVSGYEEAPVPHAPAGNGVRMAPVMAAYAREMNRQKLLHDAGFTEDEDRDLRRLQKLREQLRSAGYTVRADS